MFAQAIHVPLAIADAIVSVVACVARGPVRPAARGPVRPVALVPFEDASRGAWTARHVRTVDPGGILLHLEPQRRDVLPGHASPNSVCHTGIRLKH